MDLSNPLVSIPKFMGRYDKDVAENCPPDHWQDELNLEYDTNDCYSRRGSSKLTYTGSWNGVVKRMHRFQIPGQADHILVLDNANQLWDLTDLSSPILTVTGMTDFSLAVLYGRAYITPHNGLLGLAGEKVYVYTGSGSARAAAGIGPAGVTLTVAQGATGGHIYKGYHVFAVCYETPSGYLTVPSGFIAFESLDDTHKLNIGGIPGHGSNTAVHLLTSGAIDKELWTGDFNAAKLYFIPGARFTFDESTYTADFYDTELVDDADYLRDQRTTIPAGCGIASFKSRLYVWGIDATPATILVSAEGEPESFDSNTGVVDVYTEDPDGAVKNMAEHRSGLLYATKSHRTYSVTPSTLAPSAWEVNLIDSGEGAEPLGIGVIIDYPGASAESFLIASRSGLQLFDGRFGQMDALSDKVHKLWHRIPSAYFHLMQIVIDPYHEEIFIALPLDDATANSHILYGNYRLGLSPENIRWSLWKSNKFAPVSLLIRSNFTTKEFEILVGAGDGIYKLDKALKSDDSTVIGSWAKTAHIGAGGVSHFGAAKYRILGSGVVTSSVYGLDNNPAIQLQSFSIGAASAKEYTRLMNLNSEKGALKFGVESADEWFALYRLDLFGETLWQTRTT